MCAFPSSCVNASATLLKKTRAAAAMVPLTSLRASASATALEWSAQPVEAAYEAYLKLLRKPQTTAPQPGKQVVFNTNLHALLARNGNSASGWAAAANFFTDMGVLERAKFLGLKRSGANRTSLAAALRDTAQPVAAIAAEMPPFAAAVAAKELLPDVPEWSVALPDVKDSGACGGGWMFATTALAEAAHFIITGEVVSLSEKELIDCDSGNNGCDGGWFDSALDYIVRFGLASRNDYPYVARTGTCPATRPRRASQLASYTALPGGRETAMLEALKSGPIAVAITLDNSLFDYVGGVYSSTTCGGEVNHAVLITGAGVDSDTMLPYWLVRFAWSSAWGEGGYARILRGVGGNGMCNIASYPYQATSIGDPNRRCVCSGGGAAAHAPRR